MENFLAQIDISTSVIPEMQVVQRKDGSWLVDGMLPIDEFKELFDIEHLPNEEKGIYRTLGGFCMHQLGSIPTVGDTFTWQKFKFRIVKMDERRIERVLIYYEE